MIDLEKDNIYLRLKKIRKFFKKTQKEFALSIEISREAYAMIEIGKNNPTYDIIENVILNYKIDANWLFTGLGNMVGLSKETSNIFFIDEIEVLQNKNYDNEKEKWTIPRLEGEHIAFIVSDNQMNPTLHNGDIIIAKQIELYKDIENDKIYIVSVDKTSMIKRLRLEKDNIKLYSDNLFYEPILVKKEELKSIYRIVMICKNV